MANLTAVAVEMASLVLGYQTNTFSVIIMRFTKDMRWMRSLLIPALHIPLTASFETSWIPTGYSLPTALPNIDFSRSDPAPISLCIS